MLSRGNRNHALYISQIAANSLVGYLFARMLAYQFGTSAQKDGFDIAYSVPFIVLNLSGLAYIHSVVMTQFARMLATKSPDINSVFSVVLTWMMTVAIVLLIVAALFSESLTALLAPGLSPAVQAETRQLLLLMLPLALTLGIGTFIGAILTAHEVPITGEFCQIISRGGDWFHRLLRVSVRPGQHGSRIGRRQCGRIGHSVVDSPYQDQHSISLAVLQRPTRVPDHS